MLGFCQDNIKKDGCYLLVSHKDQLQNWKDEKIIDWVAIL